MFFLISLAPCLRNPKGGIKKGLFEKIAPQLMDNFHFIDLLKKFKTK